MENAVPLLSAPASTVPPVVQSQSELCTCAESLAAGQGEIAVDAERAGGYRYSQRAYLLQFNRRGAGTWLVDPIAVDDFAPLATSLRGAGWVLHAASQDLPGLAELGLHPPALFDTELAGRLLNLPKVGLAAMTEEYLGLSLAKAHSAADWSKRPLPADWLTYAALDVELLLDLADRLRAELDAQDRLAWAEQEFESVRLAPAPAPQPERWRKVKGLKVKNPRSLAVVRELWLSRDELAREMDRTPTKILRDATIAAAASAPPQDLAAVSALPGLERESKGRLRRWQRAVERALTLPDDELPKLRGSSGEPPHPRSWDRIDPQLSAAHTRVRDALTALAEQWNLPRENLLAPRTVRDSVWSLRERVTDPAERRSISDQDVADLLRAAGARAWQVSLTSDEIAAALRADGPPEVTDITHE